ncbi:MAG: TolC family protein [Longimicrobiales bacterium]|nr:TolC family protein [Longimicrobiales bacterium]
MCTTEGRLARPDNGTGRKRARRSSVLMLLVGGLTASPLAAQVESEALGLSGVTRSALDRNRELTVAREAYVTAQEQVSEAWSNVMPTVDLTGSYTRNVDPTVNFLPAQIFDPDAEEGGFIEVQFGADNVWNSTLSVEQPLFRPGVIVALGAARRYETLQSEVVRGVSQGVVTQVRNGYYDLLLAQEQARLTENSVRRVRESLRETQALNEAGLTSDYDVLRLQVELANLEPNLRRARNAVAQARRQLAIQANLRDHEGLRVRGTLADMRLDEVSANSPANREILSFMGMEIGAGEFDVEDVVSEALDRARRLRSDLRQLELTEELRRTEMRAEQAAYLPEVSLFGNYIISAQDNGSPNFFARGDGQRAYSTLVGVQVTIPLFQGFSRDARIDQARASVRQARANTSQGVDVAESEIRTIVESVQEALLRAEAQQLAVVQARRGFEIASAQYSEGLGSQLELTDAEVALRQSEFNYAQAVYDYLTARARLDEAAGVVPLVDVQVDLQESDTGS